MNRDEFLSNISRYVGTIEKSLNHREIVEIYNTIDPLPRGYKASITDPWCAIFVSAMWQEYMKNRNFPFECSCTQMIEILKRNNNFYHPAAVSEPQVGWLIFYDWERDGGPDHVGYVLTVNGYIDTIEGNRNDEVRVCTIQNGSSTIYGYGVLKYDDTEVENARSFVTKNKIMLGDGTDTYWQNPPTREQLAVILHRFYSAT